MDIAEVQSETGLRNEISSIASALSPTTMCGRPIRCASRLEVCSTLPGALLLPTRFLLPGLRLLRGALRRRIVTAALPLRRLRYLRVLLWLRLLSDLRGGLLSMLRLSMLWLNLGLWLLCMLLLRLRLRRRLLGALRLLHLRLRLRGMLLLGLRLRTRLYCAWLGLLHLRFRLFSTLLRLRPRLLLLRLCLRLRLRRSFLRAFRLLRQRLHCRYRTEKQACRDDTQKFHRRTLLSLPFGARWEPYAYGQESQ
jgi:hypothetical protein